MREVKKNQPSIEKLLLWKTLVLLFGVWPLGCGDDGKNVTTSDSGPPPRDAAVEDVSIRDAFVQDGGQDAVTTADAGGSDAFVQDAISSRDASDDARIDAGPRPDAGLPIIEIAGNYTDPFGGTHEITAAEWVNRFGASVSRYHFVEVNNDMDYAIARNDPSNSYNPNRYSRFEWTRAGGNLYYCQSVYDAMTAEMARSAPRANPSNPEASGCGGFPWTRLIPMR
ncbi:MAG: hypothetical protein NZM37_10410 [Sandaracinaceae bacterium]|nr:hypothetical protein [Sandaracinaceae bacterium]